MQKFYSEFIEKFGPDNFVKGMNYNSSSIKLTLIDNDLWYKQGYFSVLSERTDEVYSVYLEADMEEKIFSDYKCDCVQHYKEGMCKHIAACMLKYYDRLFEEEAMEDYTEYNLNVSRNIINNFYKPKSNNIKKKLQLEIAINPSSSSWYSANNTLISCRIGEERLYSLNGKYSRFLEAYLNDEAYKLTTKFTYDASSHYFDEVDTKILDYLAENCYDKHSYNGVYVSSSSLNSFMKLLKEHKIIIDGRVYKGYKERNPFVINLTKENGYYILKFENFNELSLIARESNFVYDENNIYKLPNKVAKLYKMLYDNEIDSLMFEKKDLEYFTSGILNIIKDNVSIDEKVDDIVIGTSPNSKLYFDFYYNAVECKVILDYNDKNVNIFEKTPNIARDTDFESNIFKKLNEFGFISEDDKQRFLLENIDSIGYFFEEGLEKLTLDYEVFTSQKIKDTKILKDNKVQVNFGIGKDNIMSYKFSVDGVSDDELAGLLENMRAKKKYYRLKNGMLLDLGNENLEEMNSLALDMELSDKELNGGTLPKYRAIFFDSLKRNRYKNIIKTNNLFDVLIDKFNAYKNIDIDLSKKEMNVLRDYQKVGVKWLYNIYKCGFGGILADEMGLGKSIQLIYLIKLIIKEKSEAKILIVSPTSLVYNWKKEFDKFGSELKYKVFAENRVQRLNDLENVSNINVLITTYGLVRNDAETYRKMNFDLMAIDEAQNIKNPKAQMTKAIKSINSNVKIALTGTPLENSVMELWSIFEFIMPGYLANNKKFQSLYNISDVSDEGLRKLDTLNMQITYFLLRRKKKDVVKELPDKIENNVYVELGSTQKKLYAAEVIKTRREMDEIIATEGFSKARFKILQLLTRLRQICIDPSIIFDNYNGGRAKIDELIKIVLEAKGNGHKILIFTTYKTALNITMKELNNNGISTYYIDGSVSSKKRMELVEKFNNNDTDVFIITLKAGGTGLNLTSATVVIHLDLWWNPQAENQATDRAHRIGQKNTVEVIRLITSGTIEERILELQEKKKKLADALIEGEMRNENQFSNLTEKDIEILLSMDNNDDVLV